MGVAGARNDHIVINLCDCQAHLNVNHVGNVIGDIDFVEIKNIFAIFCVSGKNRWESNRRRRSRSLTPNAMYFRPVAISRD